MTKGLCDLTGRLNTAQVEYMEFRKKELARKTKLFRLRLYLGGLKKVNIQLKTGSLQLGGPSSDWYGTQITLQGGPYNYHLETIYHLNPILSDQILEFREAEQTYKMGKAQEIANFFNDKGYTTKIDGQPCSREPDTVVI